MAIVVVLLPGGDREVSLVPDTLARLPRLGITHVALVRDAEMVGVVLEGWAFDTAAAEEAVAAVAGLNDGVRTLYPLAQMAVSAATTKGGVSS